MEDYLEKTEPPTPKRLAEARKKGQVAKSQDLTISVVLLVNMFVMLYFAKFMYFHLRNIFLAVYSNLDFAFDDPQIVVYWLRTGLLEILWILSPMFIGAMLSAVLINLLQVGFIFSFFPLTPKWSKINVFVGENYKKYFSIHMVLKQFFGQLRFVIVTVGSWTIVGKDMYQLYHLTQGGPRHIIVFIFHKSLQIGIFLSSAFLGIAVFDYFYQRWKFAQELKMTKREIKDEMKLLEGNISMKSKIRSLMHKLLQNQIQNYVPKANIVITEATQAQAIALIYQPDKMSAPLCVAKGSRKKAKEIIDLALKFQVPIIENSQLTKTLYMDTDVGEMVSKAFYYDVATALGQAKRQKAKEEIISIENIPTPIFFQNTTSKDI